MRLCLWKIGPLCLYNVLQVTKQFELFYLIFATNKGGYYYLHLTDEGN